LARPLISLCCIVPARCAGHREEQPKKPSDYAIENHKDVQIVSSDGVRLSAWEIDNTQSSGKNKLVVINHPLVCSKYGAVTGVDNVPCEFGPMLKHLSDAGYSIITYDQRGHGESDGGLGKTKLGPKGVPVGNGATEWQDLLGVFDYVKGHPNFSTCQIGLITMDMGANASFHLWKKQPSAFTNVKCHVAINPVCSTRMTGRVTMKLAGVDISWTYYAMQYARHGIGSVSAEDYVDAVKVPLMVASVKDDKYVFDYGVPGHDTLRIMDRAKNVPSKQLVWIGPDEKISFGTGKRFDAYNYFNQHPGELVSFLERHVAEVESSPVQQSMS
jgi:pimeloyl-ACP methyl ester carboxylesterase